VAAAAVLPGGADEDLLPLAGHQDALRRPHLQASYLGVRWAGLGNAVLQPALQEVVLAAVDLDALAAAVLHRQGRLLQEDAALRVGDDEAAAVGAGDDLGVVEGGVEAEQAQLEAAAAVLGAVTGALVAAGAGQHRHDLAAEADRHVGRGPPDLHRDDHLLAIGLHGAPRLPVGRALDEALRADGGDGRVAAAVLRIAAQIPGAAVGVVPEHAEALVVARAVEGDAGRVNGEALQGGAGRLGDG